MCCTCTILQQCFERGISLWFDSMTNICVQAEYHKLPSNLQFIIKSEASLRQFSSHTCQTSSVRTYLSKSGEERQRCLGDGQFQGFGSWDGDGHRWRGKGHAVSFFVFRWYRGRPQIHKVIIFDHLCEGMSNCIYFRPSYNTGFKGINNLNQF